MYVHVYVHIYVYVYMYICKNIYAPKHLHIYNLQQTQRDRCLNTCHEYIYICIHIHIYLYIYTYINTYSNVDVLVYATYNDDDCFYYFQK